MNMFLLASHDCSICDDAVAAFKKEYPNELKSDEAGIIYLEDDEEVAQFWAENDLEAAPVIVVVSDGKKLIATLDTEELIAKQEDAKKAPIDKQS